ncbi:ATP-dependent RNA helicase DBP10 [Bienertia sinuspersici]
MAKAENYLHKYKSSHSASNAASPSIHNPDNTSTRHIEFLKKAQQYMHKKDKKHGQKKDKKDDDDDEDDHKEHLKLAHAMLKKIKKHKGGGGGHGPEEEHGEVQEEEEIEEEEIEIEEEEEAHWFSQLMEGIQGLLEE